MRSYKLERMRGVIAIKPVDIERVRDIILYCLTPTTWKTVLKWTYSLENANKHNSHSMKQEIVIALGVLKKQNPYAKVLLQRKFHTQTVSLFNFIKYLRTNTHLTRTHPRNKRCLFLLDL